METCNIFYSWQSDIKQSKNFISDCLKRIPKKVKDISTVEITRDTEGIAGAPDIGDAIFQKIDNADIFVADVTIINSDYNGRKTPNPNVLLELGYAIKALDWKRIILLYDEDYGDIEQLPFDINHNRMMSYSLNEETKAEVRNKIISNFVATIEILKARNLLHGGQPLIKSSRIKLSNTIWEAMNMIYRYFDEKYCQESNDIYGYEGNIDFTMITEAQFRLLDNIRDVLPKEKYYEAATLLQKLKFASTGTDEAYGWEYADEVIKEYFKPYESKEDISVRSFDQAMNEKFLRYTMQLAGEEAITDSVEL